MTVIGISGLYHDSAAAVIRDGEIIAAAQEERFTRKKHDNALPYNAIDYCLSAAGVKMHNVDAVVYYDSPLLTLDRYLHTVGNAGDNAEYLVKQGFADAVTRLTVDAALRKRYGLLGREDKLLTLEHHLSHAASAFYPSPFDHAAVLTIDGVGEWETTTIWQGSAAKLEKQRSIHFPVSLGLFYDAFTAFCGFKVNSGEYKFMGLAPYGEPIYYNKIRDELINLRDDGTFGLNPRFFSYDHSAEMTNSAFSELFGGSPRSPESRISRREMDIAASAQKVTEDIILSLAQETKRITGERNLAMAGGVALNCTANGRLSRAGIFDRIWVQPAAGDAGGALGCALYAYYKLTGEERKPQPHDSQKGSYLGPQFTDSEIETALKRRGAVYHKLDEREMLRETAELLKNDKVVGWFQGRMEFGPRALGARSILASASSETMQSRLNLAVKFRESFRPFAPAVLEEDAAEYFTMDAPSPYMLFVAGVAPKRCLEFDKNSILRQFEDDMISVVNQPRSDIPAVTHVDFSARVQTVTEERNGVFYRLLREYKSLTGCGVLVNTSFNVRGQPIVCTPDEAWECFAHTGIDALVLGNYLVLKNEQSVMDADPDWRNSFEQD